MKNFVNLTGALILSVAIVGCSDNQSADSGAAPQSETSQETQVVEETTTAPAVTSDEISTSALMNVIGSGGDGSAQARELIDGNKFSLVNQVIFALGKSDSETDNAASHALIKAAYEKYDNPNLGVRLAINYAFVKGVEKDQSKALEILTKEGVSENKAALYQRARILMDDDFVGSDLGAAKMLLEKSASMNFAPAQKMLDSLNEG